jgi:type IV secretory pathway protease TraF
MASTTVGKLALLLAGVVGVGVAFTMAPRVPDWMLYDHAPSMPVGLYMRSGAGLARGAIVTVRARDVAPALAAARGCDGPADRFIKRVAAMPGDEVCAVNGRLRINGADVAAVPMRGQPNTSPTAWHGCRMLSAGEVLLLGEAPNSFDGRHWGPIDARLVDGVWRNLQRDDCIDIRPLVSVDYGPDSHPQPG